ncbi:amidase [Phyllobacterium sp. TAF24]|uniref:amidase n=1 Tax=Phyllobacterium sp. TAF24 TaxID=3233068 RepID=UPI003F944FB3
MSRSTVSARDKLEQSLATIAAGSGHAFVKLYADTAREEADASDRRARDGRLLGPLDGKIVSIKDLFDVAGETTLAGSIMRRNRPLAVKDAVIVERLRKAGAVIPGKTIMTEFAFTAVGLNPHYKVAGNAVDPSRVAGGSSTGAGISAADRTSDISIGSDTGGSIRIPASLNGVVGFKPTAKRVPREGAFPLSPSLDSIGPLARSVADCALADAVMAGEGIILPEPATLTGLRIAVPRGVVLDAMEPEIAKAFERSLQLCEKSGAILVECTLDDLIREMAEATSVGSIAGIEASRVHADWLNDTALDVDPRVQKPLLRRLAVLEADYIELMQKRRDLMRKMDGFIASYDFLAMPTAPITAPLIASVVEDDEFYKQTEGQLLRNPQIANQFDLTAISLPMPDLALPAGLMLFARHGADNRLLSMAMSVERLLG